LKEQYYPWFAQYMVMKRLALMRKLYHASYNCLKSYTYLGIYTADSDFSNG